MHPVTPLDRITNVPINTDVAATNDFMKTIKNANESARAHINNAQERQKKGYDGLREGSTFKVGDLVKLSTKNTPSYRKRSCLQIKGTIRWPIGDTQGGVPVAYRITMPENWRTVTCFMFLACVLGMGSQKCARTEPAELPPPPPPVHDDKLGDFYAVERIIKKERDLKTKRLKFLVKFEGYDDSENRWLDVMV